MEELVSVIIPAYNHEKYVQETIFSIINQTYKNIELIIIDDGSKDNTWQKINEIKDECKNRFANVVFETQENQGTCITINRLIASTKGDYIYLIASDDISKPNAIETEAQFLKNNPEYGLVVGDCEIIDENSKVCYWDDKHNIVYDKKLSKFNSLAQCIQSARNLNFNDDSFGNYDSLYHGNYVPNGYLFTKEAVQTFMPLTKEAPVEDWYIMLQISKYYKMKYIDEILFSYRWHSSNTIKQSDKMKEFSRLTTLYEEKILKEIDISKVLPIVAKTIKHGTLVKKTGIPYLFEKLTVKKYGKLYKIFKLFNIQIYSKLK